MNEHVTLRPVAIKDAEEVVRIYNHYVADTTITFEEKLVTVEEMEGRIREVTDSLPWLVVEVDGTVAGYAYASKWKGRCAYRYSVESTVYLDRDRLGKGLGRRLYTELLAQLKAGKTHCVIGGIALPNEASVGLHERMGFQKVAHFREVGWKFNRWIDVGYWELIFATSSGVD